MTSSNFLNSTNEYDRLTGVFLFFAGFAITMRYIVIIGAIWTVYGITKLIISSNDKK